MFQAEHVAQSPFNLVGLQKFQRNTVIKLLAQVQFGQLALYEQGQFIANIGDTASPLRGQLDIHDPSVYRKWLLGGSIAAGETFVDGLWDSPDLTKVVEIFAKNLSSLDSLENRWGWLTKPFTKLGHALNRNSKKGAKKNILAHYDLGNDLYCNFLDDQMQYSSAVYPSETSSLAEAQDHKLTLICDSLELGPEDHLLEIGSGWGGLAIKAAKGYGCKVTTTTISDAQYEYAQAKIKAEGLEDKITLLKSDYRDLTGSYDKVVSIEMIEAVGHENFSTFFSQCNRLLKSGGKLFIQAITIADQRYRSYISNVDFIQKHIFPGGCLPSINVIAQHVAHDTDMVIRSISDIGLDYARTLHDWRVNVVKSRDAILDCGFDQRFLRLWQFYLCYCQGGFQAKATSAIHLLAEKDANSH